MKITKQCEICGHYCDQTFKHIHNQRFCESCYNEWMVSEQRHIFLYDTTVKGSQLGYFINSFKRSYKIKYLLET